MARLIKSRIGKRVSTVRSSGVFKAKQSREVRYQTQKVKEQKELVKKQQEIIAGQIKRTTYGTNTDYKNYINNPNYTVSRDSLNNITSIVSKPVTYVGSYSYQKNSYGKVSKNETKGTYRPYQLYLRSDGTIKQEIKKSVYDSMKGSKDYSGGGGREYGDRKVTTDLNVEYAIDGTPKTVKKGEVYVHKTKFGDGKSKEYKRSINDKEVISYNPDGTGTKQVRPTPKSSLVNWDVQMAQRESKKTGKSVDEILAVKYPTKYKSKIESLIKQSGNLGKISYAEVIKTPNLITQMTKKVSGSYNRPFDVKGRQAQIKAGTRAKTIGGLDTQQQNILSQVGISQKAYFSLSPKKQETALQVGVDIINSINYSKRLARNKEQAKVIGEYGKWKYLEESFKQGFTSKGITKKSFKEQTKKSMMNLLRQGIYSPDVKLYLINEKNKEDRLKLFNKYYKEKTITYIDPLTKGITYINLNIDPITLKITRRVVKNGKTTKETAYGEYLNVLPKRLKGEVFNKLKTIKDWKLFLSKTFIAEIGRGTIKTIKGTFNVGRLIDDRVMLGIKSLSYDIKSSKIIKSIKKKDYATNEEYNELKDLTEDYNKARKNYLSKYNTAGKDFYNNEAKLARKLGIIGSIMVITSWGGSALIGSSSAPLIFAGKALKLGVGLTGKVFAINYTTSTITNFIKNPTMENTVKLAEIPASYLGYKAVKRFFKGKDIVKSAEKSAKKLAKRYDNQEKLIERNKLNGTLKSKDIKKLNTIREAYYKLRDNFRGIKEVKNMKESKPVSPRSMSTKVFRYNNNVYKNKSVVIQKIKNSVNTKSYPITNKQAITIFTNKQVNTIDKYLDYKIKNTNLTKTNYIKEKNLLIKLASNLNITTLTKRWLFLFRSKLSIPTNLTKQIIKQIGSMKVFKDKHGSFRHGGTNFKKSLRQRKPMSKAQLRQRKQPVVRAKGGKVRYDNNEGEFIIPISNGQIRAKDVYSGTLVKELPTINAKELINYKVIQYSTKTGVGGIKRSSAIIVPKKLQVKIASSPTGDSRLPSFKAETPRFSKLVGKGSDKQTNKLARDIGKYNADVIANKLRQSGLYVKESLMPKSPKSKSFIKNVAKQSKKMDSLGNIISVLQNQRLIGKVDVSRALRNPKIISPVTLKRLGYIKSAKSVQVSKSTVRKIRNEQKQLKTVQLQQTTKKGFRRSNSTDALLKRLRIMAEKSKKSKINKTETLPVVLYKQNEVILFNKSLPPVVYVDSVRLPSISLVNKIFGIMPSTFYNNVVLIKARLYSNKKIITANLFTTRNNINVLKHNAKLNSETLMKRAILTGRKLLGIPITDSLIKNALLSLRLTNNEIDVLNKISYDSMLDMIQLTKSSQMEKQLLEQALQLLNQRVYSSLRKRIKKSKKQLRQRPTKITKIIKPISRIIPKGKYKPRPPYKPIPDPIIPKIPKLPSKLKTKKKMVIKSYNVAVKVKGAKKPYSLLRLRNLSRDHAKRLGRFVTDNTKLASFRLIPSGNKIHNKFTKQTASKKFRTRKTKSKLPYKTIVEKRKYRIDTRGEKRNITLKGLAKLRSSKSIIKRLTKSGRKKNANKTKNSNARKSNSKKSIKRKSKITRVKKIGTKTKRGKKARRVSKSRKSKTVNKKQVFRRKRR